MKTPPSSEADKKRVLKAVYYWRKYAIKLTGHESAAMDLLHDVYVKMATNRKGLPQNMYELKKIAHRAVTNAYIDLQRQSRYRYTRGYVREYSEDMRVTDDDGFTRRTLNRERIEEIRILLPDDRFYIPLMLFGEGYSTLEIVKILDLKLNTVLSRISNARRKLAQAYVTKKNTA